MVLVKIRNVNYNSDYDFLNEAAGVCLMEEIPLKSNTYISISLWANLLESQK
jgi:hypothetical protein